MQFNRTTFVLALIFLGLLPGLVQAQAWYGTPGWSYRKAITIDYTKVGTGPHTNYPVLISRADTDLQARALSTGNDILFTSADGTTKLAHEIESYTSGSGTLVAWVQIPSLSSSANTVIYMYYGNTGAANQQNVTGTWNSNFVGVYHLNNAYTSATNTNNGTNTHTTNVTGKIANGSGFNPTDGDGADFITVTGMMGNPTNYTLSAWANLITIDPNAADIISLGDHSVLRYDVSNGKVNGVGQVGAATWVTTLSSTNYATGWHHVVYSFDETGNSQQVYIDGQPNGAATTQAASPYYIGGGTNTFIGKHGNANINMDFYGTIDEARVSNSKRSAGWILTDYNNQNSPSAFYGVSGEEIAPKTFSGIGNFSDATKWTGGTLPVAGENLFIDGTCTVDNNVGTDNVAYGTLTIGSATGRTLNWVASGTNRLNVTNVSAGAGASALNMTNGGSLIIRGTWTSTNLTFTPGAGTIEVQSTMTLPAAYGAYNNLTVNNSPGTVTSAAITTVSGVLSVSGTLQLATFNMTSGRLQGAGTILSSSGTPTLTTGGLNISTTFSGIIGTGAIALTKNGTGALTLSGINTYTGITTIAAGTLKLGSTNALGTTAGATSVSSGAVIDLNGINYSNAETLTLNGTGISTGGALINGNATAAIYAGNIVLNSAVRITANNPITLSGIMSGGGGLTVAGVGNSNATLTLSGANTYTAITTITPNGWLKIGSASALGAGTSDAGNGAASGNHTVINSGGVLDLNGISYSASLPEGVQMNGTGISGGGCIINSSSSPANFSGFLDTYTNATINVSNPVTLSGSVQVRSTHSLTKTGADILTLAPIGGDRSITSYIIVSAGTLKLGVNLTEAGHSGVYTRVNSGAVLDLNGYTCSRYLYLNGTGSGNGALINGGAATTHSGLVALESASSIVGGTGTIALSNTGTITGATFGLTLGGAAGGSIASIIGTTSGTITKVDAGTWILSGLNTYTGSTTVSGGILRATNNTIAPSTNGAFGNHASGLFLNGGTIQSNVATFSRPLTVTGTDSGLDAYGSARTISSTITLATAGTFNLNAGGTTAASAEGQNLTLSGVISYSTGTLSFTKIGTSTVIFGSQAITLHSLTIAAGALTSTSGTLNLAGDFANFGTFTHNSGTVTFNGSSLQGIGGGTFNNLTINNAAGATLWWDITHTAILTLSSGIVATGAFNLTGSSTASVSRTSGHVFGNFQKNFITGAITKTFEIGDATNYTPVTVAFANITTAGDLTASVVSGDHANIGTSTILPTKSVNRNWTLTNSEIAFTTYGATFTFVAGDVDGGANTNAFIVGKYSGGSWTYPTVGTRGATSTEATGLTAFSDFQLGEAITGGKTFTGTGNFSDATKWTGGTLPIAGEDLIIDGACTVDNNVGTDNVAYGTLVIGTATGRTLNWAVGGTNRLNVTSVSSGAGASTLSMTNGGTLSIGGTWTSANLTFTPGAGTVEVRSTMTLPAAYATYNNLTINAPSATVTAGVGPGITNFSILSGTVNLNTFTLTTTGTSTFTSGTIDNGTVTSTGPTTTFAGTVFGAVVNATSDLLYLNGSTFNSAVTLTKNGATGVLGTGGNTFQSTAVIANSGTNFLVLGNSAPDIFNGAVTLNNTGSSALYVAYNSPGNQFNGNVTVNNTGTGTINSASGSLATAVHNGNIILNNTSPSGFAFGFGGGVTTLAATKTISIGATGYNTGPLYLYSFNQLGSTPQSLTLTGTAILVPGFSSTFNGNVNFVAPQILLNGVTFNGTAYIEKNGAGQNNSLGGNTFNAATTLVNSAPGAADHLVLGYPSGVDTFNGDLTLTNTGGAGIYPGFNTAGHQFNGNIILNQTSAGSIYFNAGTGTSTLAAGKTISIGGSGFSSGSLNLPNFTQAGTTAQALSMTGTASLVLGPSSTFNGNVNFSAPQLYLNGSTYNGTASFTKNGVTNNLGNGGNTFNEATALTNSSSAFFATGFTTADIFNADLTITNTGTGFTALADEAAGTMFNGNIIVNSTNGTGTAGVAFGNGPGTAVTATLAAGKTISIGGTGFTAGRLLLRRFIQSGATAQSFTLAGTSRLYLGPYSTFNGGLNFIAPQLFLNESTFNGTASLTKSGATENVSSGGNIFNGVTTLANSGSASLDLGSSLPERFNTDLTINNTGGSRVQIGLSSVGNLFNGNVTINHGGNTGGLNTIIARNAGSTATFNGNLTLNCTNVHTGSGIVIANGGAAIINGNVTVSSTSGRGILFGDAAGTVTLANGFTIATAGTGTFTTGTLSLKGLTQIGGTAQNIELTGTANLQVGPASLFNGAVDFSAPQMFLNGAQYNSTAVLTKKGATDNTSTGGNIFNGATTIANSGAGFFRFANPTADDFNADATFVQTGAGLLQPAYAGNSTFAANISTAGTATPIAFGTGTGTVTLNGGAAQSVAGSLLTTFQHLTINNGNGVTLGTNAAVNGVLTFTSGKVTTGSNNLYLGSAGSVSRSSGHVVGNFRKYVATGATSKTFEVGDASTYAPVTVAFASVTTAGDLTATTVSGDHANIGTSNVRAIKSVNRNWTLTNSGIAFTTYDATFTFVAGDVDAGANTSAFIVGKYTAGSWTYPTVGTKTATTTKATGLTAFSDFQLGETSVPPSVPLVNSVLPSGTQPPGTDLVYTVVFTNSGGQSAQLFVITDPRPENTDFKLGSASTDLGTTGMTVGITYSNDGGATYTYLPVSTAGGAPAGYDRLVTHIRWTFGGNLSQTSPNNSGSVSFYVRIR